MFKKRMDDIKTSELSPGDHHYTAYIGPPEQYDFMGASQFRLLCTLGLRANHKLLDFGCGSLRAGRFFITYLNEGCYYGVEPNKWLIEDAIKNQIGQDIVRIKKPSFNYNDKFSVDDFGTKFDFIVAQSIFSHSGIDIVRKSLKNFNSSLATDGLIIATFVLGNCDFEGDGWVYPGCVNYRPSTVKRLATDADLLVTRIPWYHPRQTWYAFAKSRECLPTHSMHTYLRGAVLFDPEFKTSWKIVDKIKADLTKYVKKRVPPNIKMKLKQWFKRGYNSSD